VKTLGGTASLRPPANTLTVRLRLEDQPSDQSNAATSLMVHAFDPKSRPRHDTHRARRCRVRNDSRRNDGLPRGARAHCAAQCAPESLSSAATSTSDARVYQRRWGFELGTPVAGPLERPVTVQLTSGRGNMPFHSTRKLATNPRPPSKSAIKHASIASSAVLRGKITHRRGKPPLPNTQLDHQ